VPPSVAHESPRVVAASLVGPRRWKVTAVKWAARSLYECHSYVRAQRGAARRGAARRGAAWRGVAHTTACVGGCAVPTWNPVAVHVSYASACRDTDTTRTCNGARVSVYPSDWSIDGWNREPMKDRPNACRTERRVTGDQADCLRSIMSSGVGGISPVRASR